MSFSLYNLNYRHSRHKIVEVIDSARSTHIATIVVVLEFRQLAKVTMTANA